MPIELVVPKVGESITEVEIGDWLKQAGDSVAVDESIVVIDTAKASVELPAPAGGTITQILKQSGESAAVGEVIGYMEEGAGKGTDSAPLKEGEPAPEWEAPVDPNEQPHAETGAAPSRPQVPVSASSANGGSPTAASTGQTGVQHPAQTAAGDPSPAATPFVMPAAQAALAQQGISPETVTASGPGGRMLKEDVQHAAQSGSVQGSTQDGSKLAPVPSSTPQVVTPGADEEVVPMSLMRRTIAARLVEAQQNAALLTTFNEVDMSAVMQLRKEHQDAFQARYNIKVGFMSFFVKAVIDGLKQIPAINAEIRGKSIVYKNHYDIGVAIGSGKGLVVPVLRSAERMSFAEVEVAIAEYAGRVKNNTLPPEALEGGTFTITNGGIYGSLLSTPIVNPPQSGILGMHSIQERPIALNGQVVIRPMMYIALTYDHRIVDGREAVTFLKRVKDCIENPARMLIEV
jgi:2-oxoglutarate dehydrogenase E2 component (dihydrolipoamide succinyltransferase)